MNATLFTIERTFNAPLQSVWEAISDKDQMRQWYFELSEFKPKVGFEFRFPGQGHKGEQYLHICVVKEAILGKKLAYTWTYENIPGESLLTYELFPEGEKTRLKLTHSGLETFPAHPDFAKESFAEGWTHLINISMAEFLEKPK